MGLDKLKAFIKPNVNLCQFICSLFFTNLEIVSQVHGTVCPHNLGHTTILNIEIFNSLRGEGGLAACMGHMKTRGVSAVASSDELNHN